jgi:hypothetical protein
MSTLFENNLSIKLLGRCADLLPKPLRTATMNGLIAYDSSSDEEGAQTVVEVRKVGIAPKSPVNGTAQIPAHGNVQPLAASKVDTANNAGGALLGPTMPDDVIDTYEEQSEQDIMRRLTRATHPMSAIPDSPPGSPDPAANARIERFLELKEHGVHFNEDLARKSTFRNPSLLSNMMKRAGIDEDEQYTTSLPIALWDPSIFPEWSYKEGLLKIQQALREKDETAKKVQSAGGNRTIEFASASNSGGCSRHSSPNQQSKHRRP